MIKEGDVVLAPLPQADGLVKNRPALVLKQMPTFGDLLVCGISTQLQHAVAGFDEILQPSDSDFTVSGLKAASVIRLGYLAVLPTSHFVGRIGAVNDGRRNHLLLRLCNYLCAPSTPAP